MSDDIKKGLLGIVVDETEVSKVMPEINSLTYRGYAAQDLLEAAAFPSLCLIFWASIFIMFVSRYILSDK